MIPGAVKIFMHFYHFLMVFCEHQNFNTLHLLAAKTKPIKMTEVKFLAIKKRGM